VSTPETTDVLTCALCGRACVEVDGGRGWFHLEVTREEPVDDLHWWEVDFCSQAHAAEWFGRPLPSPIRGDGEPRARTSADRWEDAGCFAVFSVMVVLLLLGTWTAVRLVLSLF
jgi:hypothetical protein